MSSPIHYIYIKEFASLRTASLWPNELGMGLLDCYEVWVGGRSWVRAPAWAIVRRVFHPTRKLVRFYLLKCPSISNSKNSEIRSIPSPRGEV